MKLKTILTTFAALMLSANVAFAGGNYIVNTSSANLLLRSGAGTNYSIKARMPKGAQVYVNYINGAWANVTYNGMTGFASAQYLKEVATPTPVVVNDSTIQSVKDRIWNLYNYTNGYKRNTRNTHGGQCWGFANAVYTQMFNVSRISGYTYDNFGMTSYSGSYIASSLKNYAEWDVTGVKNAFMKAKPGAFVQMGRRYSKNSKGDSPKPHSAIIYELYDSGLYLYEANADNRDTIQVNWYDWSALAKNNLGFTIYLPNNYRLR